MKQPIPIHTLSSVEKSAPPTNVAKNIPMTGMFDERWNRFEDVYGMYIRDCIKEIDPAYEKALHDLTNRIEKFMIDVMPHYEYNPEIERFRTFLRRLVHATVKYLKSGAKTMADWKEQFAAANESADADELEEFFDDVALGETFASADLTEEEVLEFKDFLAKKHICTIVALGVDKVNASYRKCLAKFLEQREKASLGAFLASFDPKDAA